MSCHGLIFVYSGEDGRRKGRKEENRKLNRIEKITHTGMVVSITLENRHGRIVRSVCCLSRTSGSSVPKLSQDQVNQFNPKSAARLEWPTALDARPLLYRVSPSQLQAYIHAHTQYTTYTHFFSWEKIILLPSILHSLSGLLFWPYFPSLLFCSPFCSLFYLLWGLY